MSHFHNHHRRVRSQLKAEYTGFERAGRRRVLFNILTGGYDFWTRVERSWKMTRKTRWRPKT